MPLHSVLRFLLTLPGIVAVAMPAVAENTNDPFRPYDPDPQTFILYHFDEGMGDVAVDASVHGLNATLHGATWTEEGRFGRAMLLEGASHAITPIPSVAILGSFTLEAWVFPTGSEGEGVVFDGGYSWAPVGGGCGMGVDPTGRVWAYQRIGHDPPCWAEAVDLVPLNEWSHVATVNDGDALSLFVNGVLSASSECWTGEFDWATIGRTRQGTDYFHGRIDELRVSSSVRNFVPVPTGSSSWSRIKALYRID